MTSPSTDLPVLTSTFLDTLDAERRRLGIPGAIVAVRTSDGARSSAALGVRDLAAGTPLSVDSVLRVGSVTKTIVGTVVLRLVERGDLALDDDVRDLVPDLPVPSGVTVRRLLDMTSGLPEYTTETFLGTLLAAPERVWEPRELLDLAFTGEQHFVPGTSWEYCNAGYILLGMLVEQVTGELVEDLARRLVLDPLGMSDTALPARTPEGRHLPDPTVRGYLRDGDQLVDATDINPSWGWTAGNAISTAADLVLLAEELVRGDLLTAETQAARLAAVPVPDTEWAYGLGIANFGGIWGHNGQLPGFQAFAGHEPATGRTIVVLANVDRANDETNAADTLAALVRRHLAAESA